MSYEEDFEESIEESDKHQSKKKKQQYHMSAADKVMQRLD